MQAKLSVVFVVCMKTKYRHFINRLFCQVSCLQAGGTETNLMVMICIASFSPIVARRLRARGKVALGEPATHQGRRVGPVSGTC